MKARKPGFAILAALVAALLLLPAAASAACPNEEIRAAQKSSVLPEGSIHFSDCMALEQVSGQKKENQYAKYPQVSSDAERILYYSAGAIDDPPNLLSAIWNRYVATRGASGWVSSAAAPPDPTLSTGVSQGNGQVFSPDLTRWFHLSSTLPQFQLRAFTVFQGGIGGAFSQLSPLVVPNELEKYSLPNTIEGASADHSHFYFKAGPANDNKNAYLPGDPEPAGSGSERNAYVALLDSAGNADLELLARDGNGKAWGGNCGAAVGGMGLLLGFHRDRNQGAISADGSRVYLTTRPTQPASGDCSTANSLRIMQRLETPLGPEITHLVPNEGAGECDRVSPACAAIAGDDLYQGASVDQSKVFFTTNRQLADTDLDGEGFLSGCAGFFIGGCDLYLYDSSEPVGERLIQVSAGETNASHEAGKEAKVLTSIPAISGDGSHVYFVAEGVLTDEPNPEGAVAQTGQRNLYLYQRDENHPDGRLVFVGAAASNDHGLWNAVSTFRGRAYPVPATGKDSAGNEIGGDGHVLLFQSKASLTADDADGGFTDIFRYDAEAGTLERVSKAAPGGQDDGPFDLSSRRAFIGLFDVDDTNGTDYAEAQRWVSEDGESVVFRTEEGLLPEDTNGARDSYLVRGGQLYRLPGTTDPFEESNSASLNDQPVLSHDGSVVAFTSRELLLPSDGDTAIDVYSLRANGGYPIESEPRICSGEECQGAMGALPAGVSAASASAASNGNVKSKPRRRCPKGKRKARRAGKVRCVAKKAHKAKRNKAKKRRARAGRKQGGQK